MSLTIKKRLSLEVFNCIYNNSVKLHDLQTLFWECTLRCNLSCRHCGSDCHVSSDHSDMPIEDFIRVIDEITPYVKPNKLLVIFTGGEALVRKDIEKCGYALYQRGFPWGIVSNGLYLNRARLDSLISSGIRTATISLDGFEEAHNWMRGKSQSYIKAFDAICMLAKTEGIVWDVVTCVNQKNFHDLDRFKEHLIGVGVTKWRLFTVFPVGRAADIPELQLSDNQFKELMDFISYCRKEGRIDATYGCEGFLGSYEGEVRDSFYNCGAGVNVASVLADGSISGCPSIRSNFHQGNIYKDKFIDVWNNRFESFRNREWMRKGECGNCKMFRYCKGNGMHLRDDKGDLLFCHYKRLKRANGVVNQCC